MQLIHAGKGEAIRIRAILRSLIPIEDLEGVISLPFHMPTLAKGNIHTDTHTRAISNKLNVAKAYMNIVRYNNAH